MPNEETQFRSYLLKSRSQILSPAVIVLRTLFPANFKLKIFIVIKVFRKLTVENLLPVEKICIAKEPPLTKRKFCTNKAFGTLEK